MTKDRIGKPHSLLFMADNSTDIDECLELYLEIEFSSDETEACLSKEDVAGSFKKDLIVVRDFYQLNSKLKPGTYSVDSGDPFFF